MTTITTQGGPATTRPATTQNPGPATTQNPPTKQDLQTAAQQLRDAVLSNVQADINSARIEAAAQKAAAAAQRAAAASQGEPIIAPEAPPPPRTFTIRGRDGTQTITIPPNTFDNVIPQQVVDISIAFFLTMALIIIGLPLARAFGRRMDRRGGSAQVSNEVSSQLAHLNQAVDAIALEVERISEGQRFTTRLLSEQKEAARQTLPSGANR
jgi:hypothetical protein